MKFLRKGLASLLTLFAINIGMLALFFFALASTYLDADFYESESVQYQIYPNLVDEISGQIFEREPELALYFSESEMKQGIQSIFPFQLLLEMIDELFEQFQHEPFPDQLVISTETLKRNLRAYVESDPQLAESVDPTTIDYMSNSIVLPLDRLPLQVKQSLGFLLQNSQTISYGLFGLLFLLLLGVALVAGSPLSHRSAWVSGILLFTSAPVLALGYSLKKNVSDLYPFDHPLAQSLIAPYLDFLMRTSFIFFAVGSLCFGMTIFLKFALKR